MGTCKTIKIFLNLSVAILLLTSCAKTETELSANSVLASSAFYPGDPTASQNTYSQVVVSPSDGGVILPPGSGTSIDTGSISAPSVTGTTTGSSTTTSGSTSTTTPSGTTSGSSTSGGTSAPTTATTSGATTTPSGTSSSSTSTPSTTTSSGSQPSSSDGGVINLPSGSSGSDTGSVGTSTNPNSSTTSTSGTVSPTDPSTSSSGSSTTDPSTSASGSSSSGNSTSSSSGSVASNDTGTTGSGSSTPTSSSDGGVISNGGTSSGSDSGSVSSGSNQPGSDTGSTSTSGGTTQGSSSSTDSQPAGGGSSTGSDVASSGGSSSAGTDVASSGGGTSSTSDGGSISNGSGQSSGTDGGSVTGSNPGSQTDTGSAGGSQTLPPPSTGGESIIDKIKDIIGDLKDKMKDIVKNEDKEVKKDEVRKDKDGGEVKKDNDKKGTDQGKKDHDKTENEKKSCHQNDDRILVGFSRVCSVNRSKSSSLFFEEAKHPILVVEANIPVKSHVDCRGSWKDELARAGMVPIKCGVNNVVPYVGNRRPQSSTSIQVLVATKDLSGVDLLEGRFKTEILYDRDWLKSYSRIDVNKISMSIVVCEDSNLNGSCLEESYQNMLSLRSPWFPANRIPQKAEVDVWSGRYLTRSSDPEFCEKQYSPLVLDLSGKGFTFTSAEDGVWFDLNDEGKVIRTAWVQSPDLAFLVRDVNGNGKIDSGAELFGSATRLRDGSRAENGFLALMELDSDGDRMFSRNDDGWRSVKVWIDRNYNGSSEKGEIVSLSSANIESINLQYVDVAEIDPNGNETRQRSTYSRRDRRDWAGMVIDIWFSTLIQSFFP